MPVQAVTVAPNTISEMTQTSSSSIMVKPSERRKVDLITGAGS